MNIIDELNRQAETHEIFDRYASAVDLRTIADRLAASGALVPVPDGEPLPIRDAESTYIAVDGHVYVRLDNGDWCGIADATPYLYQAVGDYDDDALMVQPVRLVPLKEAEV